jgi:hypothetical protein
LWSERGNDLFSLELVKVDSSVEGLLAYVAGETAFHAQPFGRVFVQQLFLKFKKNNELNLLQTFEKSLYLVLFLIFKLKLIAFYRFVLC